MNIHPIWYICLLVRLTIAYCIYNNYFSNILLPTLAIISTGFIYKGYTGSNNEKQIAKVFWHDSRYHHAIFYSLATYYLYLNNYKFASLFVLMDVIYSVVYRIIFNK